MKTCTICGAVKPLDLFFKNSRMRDGHLNQCRACLSARRKAEYQTKAMAWRKTRRAYYLKTREARVAAAARYRNENRERDREYARGETKRNPIKRKARAAVVRARLSGRLVPGPCARCGESETVHGHHEDYSRPLDVVWLCPACHGQRHREMNEEMRNVAEA